MSKKIGVIIGGVILLGVIGFLAFSQLNKPSSQTSQNQSNSQSTSEESVTKGSIKSLLLAGKNVYCKMTYPDQSISGMTFVSGNKMRGDFNFTDSSGKEMISHMINDGTFAHMWTDGSTQGTKMKIDELKSSGTPSAQTQTADLDKEVDLKCSPWAVDVSKFNPPSDIQFSDLTQMIKNVGSSMPKIDKSICDSLTDAAAKASCLKSLGGN